MNLQRSSVAFLAVFFCCFLIIGCSEKTTVPVTIEKLAEFSDRLGQASVKLFRYSGDADEDYIKEYSEKLGCKMIYAYFYPATVPLAEIPVDEINMAKTYTEAYDILYSGGGFAKWRFVTQCFSMIPVISDCYESPVARNCR